MKLSVILALVLAGPALAGPRNMGPGTDQVKEIWASAAISTTQITSTAFYEVGLDGKILVDVDIRNIDPGGGATVNVTPIWLMPGGGSVGYATELITTPGVLNWTGIQAATFTWEITPPHGAQRMYLQAVTSESNGAQISAKVLGW